MARIRLIAAGQAAGNVSQGTKPDGSIYHYVNANSVFDFAGQEVEIENGEELEINSLGDCAVTADRLFVNGHLIIRENRFTVPAGSGGVDIGATGTITLGDNGEFAAANVNVYGTFSIGTGGRFSGEDGPGSEAETLTTQTDGRVIISGRADVAQLNNSGGAVDGILVTDGGTLNVVHGSGGFTAYAGSYTRVASGGVFNLAGASSAGNITIDAGGTLRGELGPGSAVDNLNLTGAGTFSVGGAATIAQLGNDSSAADGILVSGTLSVVQGSGGFTAYAGSYTRVASGGVFNLAGASSDGNITIDAGGTLRGELGVGTAVESLSLQGAGTLWVAGSASIAHLVNSSGAVDGVRVDAGGTITILSGGGGFDAQAGSFTHVAAGGVLAVADLSNAGTLTIDAGGALIGAAAGAIHISNTGIINGDIHLGGDDADTYSGGGQLIGQLYGGGGADTFTGGATTDVFFGEDGADLLVGNGAADTLNGGDGDDTLNGGPGVDAVNGGNGADTFVYAIGDGNGSINGGADTDTLNLTDGMAGAILNANYDGAALTALSGNGLASVETITADLGGGVDWLIYSATAAVTVNLATGAASGFASITGVERVVGGSGNDSLTGDGLDNRLDGGEGDDVLSGAGGVDTLIGGDGADVISGGLANDSLQGNAGNDAFSWAVGDGRDTIDGGADADTFNAAGTAAVELGNATWNGAAITALMDNALSNIEAINLDLGGGVDWLIYNASAAVTVNLAANSASGFASVTNIEKVIGGSGGDTLTGDGLDNRLDGQGGGDTLDGGAGSDAVLGGDGDDIIYASAGNDSLQGQNGNDTFHWSSTDGRDTFNGGADTDTANLTGSAAADVADTNWNGSAITGLLNNALVDIELINLDLGAGGAGGDWLRYNTTFGVSVDLGAGTATGFASIAGIENLIGGTGGDSLTGDGGANKINGNNGDDVITGGGGADNLTGGAGSDTFVYATGAGNDTIVDFDAWDVGGQDFLDVSAFGINAGNFAARVAIIDTGADTVIRIDDTYFITLKNVSGDGDNVITQADFIFGP